MQRGPFLLLWHVPKGCVPNDVGMVYSEFAINTADWETIRELAAIVWLMAHVVKFVGGALCGNFWVSSWITYLHVHIPAR
jgi:hypothetical protein